MSYLIVYVIIKLMIIVVIKNVEELRNEIHNNDPFDRPGKKRGAIISRLSIIFM